jgi:GntR family transcriptional regulator/MocR family aminotransferase
MTLKDSTLLVRLDGQGTLYGQIHRALRNAILSGQIGGGSRLPSSRVLATELGVSRNAVLAAYGQLVTEGYLSGRVGSGTYVASELVGPVVSPDQPRDGARRTPAASPRRLSGFSRRTLDLDPSPILQRPGLTSDFRYGLPAVGDFPHTLWARLMARRAQTASIRSLGYGEPEGYLPLREALADYLRRARGVVCEPGQILIVNGSQQALDITARVLVDPGDAVVIEDPHYEGARQVFVAAGARLFTVPVDAEGLDVANLPRSAASARIVYVTPSHQFPTGAVMPLERRLRLLGWARAADGYILEDDYDSEYMYGSRPVEAVQALDRNGRVIYVGTFSKVLFPSLRLGYLVLPPPLVKAFTVAKWLTDRHTPTLEQGALTDFIRLGHFARHLRRSRARNAARRRALLEAIEAHLGDRVEISGANAGIHVLIWLKNFRLGEMRRLVERAERTGVGIYPVTPYYSKPPRGAGLLLGYASMDEPEIRAGIQRLAGLLK